MVNHLKEISEQLGHNGPTIIKSTSLNDYKMRVKAWVPDNCPCRLCKTYIPELGFANINE